MIEKAILDTLARFSLLEKNTVVTVALSGGADSMALLTALVKLKTKLGITVKAAHLNHLIRGDEALRDEEFVKQQCKSLGIELICERADVPSIAKDHNQSLELAARTVRYEFLNRVNEGVIATAHTASDNLETVILNLSRGTSIDGLCGIPVKRDSFIRPLLFCTREMIEEYCRANKIPFVTDSTNLSDDYTRNKIRHSVVPVLKSLNPSVEKSVLRTSLSLKEISDGLKVRATEFLNTNCADKVLSLNGFKDLEPEIAKRVIVEFVKRCDNKISLENCHIEEINKICLTGGRTSIPNNKSCTVKNNCLSVIMSREIPPQKDIFEVKITKKGSDFLQSTKNVNNLFLNNSLDCDKIIGKSVIRTRKSGDSIRLKNRGCTKSLTKLYNECGIPVSERDIIPVIADDKGVVWIHGIGVAQRCAVSENTKKAYIIEVKIKEK